MAENVQSNIIINVDTKIGIAQIKNLQRQVSSLNAQLLQSGAAQARAAANVQRNLLNNINATGQFAASVRNISSTTETFTNRLEKNKFGLGEYFRYAGGASKTFGRLFTNEFNTIEKVARERVKTIQTQFAKLGRNANGSLQAIAVRPLVLDMNDLGTKTAMAAQKQQIFNQLIRQGSTNLLNFGKNTQWAGRQLMVGFSIPLAYIGAFAGKTFMKMEEQTIRFRKVYGEMFTSDAETEKALKNIKRLADEFTKYGIAAEETMRMAADAAQTGLTGSALEAQVAQATRLSVLGGVDQDSALKTTIALQNAFKTSTEDLASSINFLNSVENQTVLSLEDVSEAIPRVGPIITELGGDIKDLAFFLTAMKEGGVRAAEGANALKSGLGRLINPSRNATAYLEQFGINLNKIIESNAGDLRGTVMAFADAIAPLDDLARTRAVEKVFGKFQFARTLALLNNITKDGSQASKVLKLTSASVEELAILAERELKMVEDSPAFKFKKSMEDLKVSLIPLGEAFIKAVTPIVEFFKGVLDNFNNMSDGAKQFAVLLTTVVGGIGPVLLMTFGLIANGAANIIKLFAAIKNVFSGLGGQSNLLSSQTEYLTQQQLEAAAIASSLDQKHSKLIQTFTSETAAVNNLASAYGRAIVAQSRLLGVPLRGTGVPATKAMPVQKYASGVVSVPGPKGAGDVVPAMLSPGEAVIPTKMAQKYGPLINSMISDSVPGFYNGKDAPYKYTPRDPSIAFPAQFLLEASHMSPGTGVLSASKARQVMNQEIDSLIRQGILKESMVDRSVIDKISKEVRLNSQTAGMLTKTFNQFFTDKNAVKDVSSVLKEISKTKALSGGSLIPNMDYLVKNGMVGQVKDSTTEKYLKDLDSSFRSMITNSKSKALSERQLQDLFVKAQADAERKIVSVGEKDSIRKANIFGRATTSPAIPGTGASGRTNLPNPYVGYRDTQEQLRSPETRKRLMSFAKVTDTWAMKNSMKTLASQADRDAIKNLFRTLPEAEARKLMLSLAATDGNQKDVKNIIQAANNKSLKAPEIKAQPIQAAKSSRGSQVFSMTEILGPQGKAVPAGKAGIIARLFGKRFASGTKSVKPFNRASMLASMLGRSNVAVRMKSDDFLSALSTGGKNARYKGAFETGTGADYRNKSGSVNTRQQQARAAMERDLFGLDPRTAAASARPTYGYAKTSILQSLVNSLLGTKGKNFNAITANQSGQGLGLYGNIDLVTKSSVAKRSSAYLGDTLMDYVRTVESRTRRYPNFNVRQKDLQMPLASMRGATPDQLKYFERLGSPFGSNKSPSGNSYWTNPKNPYIETQTPGGFAFKEIQKVIAKDPVIAKQLRAELKSVGLGSVRVSSSDFFSKLFSKMGIPGYNNGIVSVPGPKGAGDVVPAMLSPGEAVIPASMSKKYAPLINSMISDSIPGYRKGKKSFNFGEKYTGSQGMPLQPVKNTPALAGKQMAESFTSRMKAAGTRLGDVAGTSMLRAQNFAAAKMENIQSKKLFSKPAPFIGPMPKPEPKQPGAMSGKLAAFGGMAGMGAMMYGMSGGPGADIAGQIGMPLMMLSMVLPMIANKTGMVVAGLLAVGGAIAYLVIRANEATKAGLAMGKAMSMTSDRLEDFALLNGVVTSSQEAERVRETQLTGESNKKRRYGQGFLESEAGQALLLDAESMTKSGMTNEQIAKNFSNQLSYAVLQGAVTQDQAASIAAALGDKLQDYSITANIVGNLTALYGRNGENLLKDPLSISLGIQEQATQAQTSAFENFQGTVGTAARDLPRDVVGLNLGFFNPVLAVKSGLSMYNNMLKTNEGAALATQLGAEQIAQNQGLLDSLNDRYDTQIRELELKKENAKTDEERLELEDQINQKINERDSAVSRQKIANKKVFDGLLEQASKMGPVFNTAVGTAIDERFKDATGSLKLAAEMVKSSLASLPDEIDGKTNTFKVALQFGVAAGQFDPIVATNLINASKEDGSIETNFNLIATAQGTGEANQLLQLIGRAGVKTENYGVILNYISKNPKTFKQDQEALAQIANMENEYGIKIDLNVKGAEKIKSASAFLQATGGLKGKPVTKEIITSFITDNPGMSPTQKANLEEMLSNWDVLSGGDNKLSYEVMVDYVIGKANDAAIWAYYISKNPQLANATISIQASLMPKARADFFADGGDSSGKKDEDEKEETEEASGTRADILDDLLKRLQNVRKASVNVNGGITELMSLLKTGKNFTGFRGIEQQLSLKGYSEEFIRFMADADKADQKRFMTNEKGVVRLKESGKALQNLFASVTLGNFERSIRESIGSINKELDARKTLLQLTKMSYNEAAEAARDAGLAEAIAAIKSNTAIKKKNKAIREAIALYKEEQAALESAKTAQEQFEDVYNAQMDLFSAKQATIDVAFEIETESFNDAMASAQADIDKKINQIGGLDDLQAGLQSIAWQEDAINKKYDERLDALDEIERANEKIANQQKGQLSVAEAISRGDISAAASAAQELRASSAKTFVQTQREILERSRGGELEGITATVNGVKKTRKQIEEDILKIEKEIFKIEEDRLEPARESIRLATVARDIKLDALDDEKVKWDELKAKVDLATASASQYLKTLQEAAALAAGAGKNAAPAPAPAYVSPINPDTGKWYTGPTPVTPKQYENNGYVFAKDSNGNFITDDETGGLIILDSPFERALNNAKAKTVGGMAMGGLVPKYFVNGGFAKGTDTVPAMLTPGEFVVKKYAVDEFGVDNLKSINNGTYKGDSVYNYELNVNMSGADLNAEDVAKTVIAKIKQIDSQRIRGNSF
jgi:TP901 family phage tail tape measure protein